MTTDAEFLRINRENMVYMFYEELNQVVEGVNSFRILGRADIRNLIEYDILYRPTQHETQLTDIGHGLLVAERRRRRVLTPETISLGVRN